MQEFVQIFYEGLQSKYSAMLHDFSKSEKADSQKTFAPKTRNFIAKENKHKNHLLRMETVRRTSVTCHAIEYIWGRTF